MNNAKQLPMTFSKPEPSSDELPWLGLVMDHRQLFDALQDEWLRPPEGAVGWALGVRAFATGGATAGPGNRIMTHLEVNLALLPSVEVLVRRDRRWVATSIAHVSPEDEALLWPGALPGFAISRVLVATTEEQRRLEALARQVSNVALPGAGLELLAEKRTWSGETPLPADVPAGLLLPPDLDAIRGATAMAVWAVPRIEPWLDLLTESLALQSTRLPQLARQVSAPWWAWPPWLQAPDSEQPTNLQERLWLAAIQELLGRHSGEAVGSVELVQAIATAAARGSSEADSAALDRWAQETLRLLRADTTLSLEDWKAAPVGKALQLVLLRSEPASFKTWPEELPTIPPAVWWSAATLCGLLRGYRRLELQFRGEAAQRQLLSIHALRTCSSAAAEVAWPTAPAAAPGWRRQSGNVVLSWGGTDFASKPEHMRGRWFSANMDDQGVRRAAEDLARRFGWPCLYHELALEDEQLRASGPGRLEVVDAPSPRLAAHGPVKLRLPPGKVPEEVFDAEEFLRCMATEAGANVPAPPVTKRNVVHPPPLDVPGLLYIRDFLSESEEAELVEIIDKAEWRKDLQRRVQHYGWRYDYKARRVDASMRLGSLPAWAVNLAERLLAQGLVTQLPDQVIVNEYCGKQGISKHVDCVPCFADGIAMISLLESWEMIFKEERRDRKVTQLLERRSVAVLTGDARYHWSHEIPARVREPSGVRRTRRISVTFRKVKEAEERG